MKVNNGAATARNAGWALATQPFIAFLDADDSWHPRKIEIQFRWMIDHPGVSLTGHACLQVEDGYGPVIDDGGVASAPEFFEISRWSMLLSNRFSTPSVMLRRDLPQRFPDGKRYSEDYQLWAEICCAGLACQRSELPLAYLYKPAYGAGGLSAALWRMARGELDTYAQLYRKGYIRSLLFLFLLGLSLIKFQKRLLIAPGIRRTMKP